MHPASEFSLRPAREADLPFLEALRRETMRAIIERHYPWDDAAQRERVLAHFDCARIVSCGGADIGLFKVVREPAEIHLSQVQILPSHQGRGIARALIAQLLADAATARLPVTLHVLRSNRALALYRRLGFAVEREDEHFFFMKWTPSQKAHHRADSASLPVRPWPATAQ